MNKTIAPLLIALSLAACDDNEAPAKCMPLPSAKPLATAPEVPRAEPAPAQEAPSIPATTAKSTEGPAVAIAASEPEPEPEPEVDVNADLYVKRLVVAEGVKDREPVAIASSFGVDDGRIYAFVEVGNRDRTDSEIFVSFRKKGEEELGRIRLRVGASPRWRTWAFTRLANEPGEWEVIVRDARGEAIGREAFTVEEAAVAPKTEPLI